MSLVDKELKELQDILEIFGPLCTVYENLLSMFNTIGTDSVIQLEKDSVSAFLTCIKHAMLLVGGVSTCVTINRRELVLKKINVVIGK